VFSVDPTDAPVNWRDGDHVMYVGACPFRGYIIKSDRIRSGQLRVSGSGRNTRTNKQAVSSRSIEEYRRSACEDSTCDFKTLCVILQWYWECVI
jgi:hypothetical protein